MDRKNINMINIGRNPFAASFATAIDSAATWNKLKDGGAMKIDGGCYCGRVTYTAEVDPHTVTICHCSECQTLSGSAFRTLAFADEGTFALSGAPKSYIKTTESGGRRELYFCGECGTPICSSAVSDGPKAYSIRVGTIRQRADLPPQSQIWFRSAQAWVTELAALPTFQKDASPNFREKAD